MKLTEQQQMWVCAQIDHWYYHWKGSLVPPDCVHPFGAAKENLKSRLCEMDAMSGGELTERQKHWEESAAKGISDVISKHLSPVFEKLLEKVQEIEGKSK